MTENYAKYLLNKTRDDYNKIADYFSSKRRFLPKDIIMLKKYIKKGDKILDVGCGNGILYNLFSNEKNDNIEYFGVDISENLINIAKQKYPKANFQTIDFLKLPFPDNYFDKVYCLATLHHIPSEKYRLTFLKEIHRILKPNGILILTVWYLLKEFKNIVKNFILKILNKSKLDFGDIFVPFKNSNGQILVNRYIHCFTKKELKRIVQKAGFQIQFFNILQRGHNKNIHLIGKKFDNKNKEL